MLSDENIRRINNQIDSKLRELDRPFKSSEEKEEIRKDLIVLNDLLRTHKEEEVETQPSTKLVDEIAQILRTHRR